MKKINIFFKVLIDCFFQYLILNIFFSLFILIYFIFLKKLNIFLIKSFDFIFWLLLIFYFIFCLIKFFIYYFSLCKLIQIIDSSPISVIIATLGKGKTLLLTYLSFIMKYSNSIENFYSNFPIENKEVKILTFKNLDFEDKTKLIPPDNSLILFDESFLYIDGTSPHTEKIKHKAKIPWILSARHLKHRAIFTAQREGMLWNNIRELSNIFIIPISLSLPYKNLKLCSFFRSSFFMNIAIFSKYEDYIEWKKRFFDVYYNPLSTTKDRRRIFKSIPMLNIYFLKILIPFRIIKKFNSHWLSFIRDLKNDSLIEKSVRDKFWSEVTDLNHEERLKEFDIDILIENLGLNNNNEKKYKKMKFKKKDEIKRL